MFQSGVHDQGYVQEYLQPDGGGGLPRGMVAGEGGVHGKVIPAHELYNGESLGGASNILGQ